MKADVISLAVLLSAGQADTLHLARYYDEVLRELGQQQDTLAKFSLVPFSKAEAQVTLPDEAIRLLAVYYEDRALAQTSIRSIAAARGPNWRDHRGGPVSYTEDEEGARTFRVVPWPREDPDPFIPVFWSPFGQDYPGHNIAALVTERRDNLPRYLDLWMALMLCEREFLRDSTHMDPAFAGACNELAKLVGTMVL